MHLDEAKQDFLAKAGWGLATIKTVEAMAGDASTKSFHRIIKKNGACAILMHMPLDDSTYSSEAHLAQNCQPFLTIGAWLARQNLSVPKVLFADVTSGLILLEDFGNLPYQPHHISIAIDILLHLHQQETPRHIACAHGTFKLPHFTEDIYVKEPSLFVEWFLPYQHIHLDDSARQSFIDFWRQSWAAANQDAPKIMLRDYHSPNFIHLPDRDHLRQIGILDYQDALLGTPLYDLVSLTQDARIDMSEAEERAALSRYRRARAVDDAAYALLGAQRAMKVLGIFVRFAKQDGKSGYLKHMARVLAYLRRNLRHEVCAPLNMWLQRHARGAL